MKSVSYGNGVSVVYDPPAEGVFTTDVTIRSRGQDLITLKLSRHNSDFDQPTWILYSWRGCVCTLRALNLDRALTLMRPQIEDTAKDVLSTIKDATRKYR